MVAEGITMKYKVWFDHEKDVLYIQTFDKLGKEEVYGIVNDVNKELKGKGPKQSIVDLTHGSSAMVDREARKTFREVGTPEAFASEKIAVFGASPTVRMLAKVILAITGVSKRTRFFKTEQEALAWLKGE